MGKADLDLSQYGLGEFQVHTLSLRDCQFEGASIEVHLKGAEKVRRQASTRNTPGLAAANSAEDLASNSAMIKLQEEMENLQKDIEKNQGDHTRLIKDLNEKNNDMQTAFENAKQSTTLAQKKYKDESDRYIEAEQELKKITKTISERQEQFNINQDRLKVKEREITKLSKIKDEKQAEL